MTMKQIAKIQKFLFGSLAVMVTVGSSLFFTNSDFLTADVFLETEEVQILETDTVFYIPDTYKSKVGQVGEIVVKIIDPSIFGRRVSL